MSSILRDFEALEGFSLVALAQCLLQTLDVLLEEPGACSVADPLNMRVHSPESSLQLTVLRVSLQSLSDFSSRGYRYAQLCFRPGVAPLPVRHVSLRSCGGATSSAVYSAAVVLEASRSATLLPLGGGALRWSPFAVVTS